MHCCHKSVIASIILSIISHVSAVQYSGTSGQCVNFPILDMQLWTPKWYGDGLDDTAEENSSILSLIQMWVAISKGMQAGKLAPAKSSRT